MKDSPYALALAALAALLQGCASTAVPVTSASQARQGQLCRMELGRCYTIRPAELTPSEAALFDPALSTQP